MSMFEKKSKPEWLECGWTRDELSVSPGIECLAMAVCRQWQRDGKPKHDKDGVALWLGIVADSLRRKHMSEAPYEIGGELWTRNTCSFL